ncbi:MAG: terminase large subunit domain-containing protein [Sediminibacterium sp.]
MRLIKVKFNTQKKLNEPHRQIFHSPARFKVVAAGRRFGKTYLSAYKLITASLHQQGLYYYIAPTFQQARDIIWKVLKAKVPEKVTKNINESRLEIEFINNSVIQLKSAEKPDTLRGVSLSGAILDEFAMMRNSDDVWQEAIRPALSDKQGFAMFISSPRAETIFMIYTIKLKCKMIGRPFNLQH